MKNFLTGNLKRLANVIEHPELINTIGKNINRNFVANNLLLKKIFLTEPNTIFDIGAAIGEWTKSARYTYPNSTIYAFEPIYESFQKLLKLKITDDKLILFNCALSNKNGITNFNLNEFSFSSSLLEMTNTHKEIFPFTKNDHNIQVECLRFDSISNINIIKPAFLKMDVQGAELLVLQGCGSLIDNIDFIELELNFEHFYKGQASYSEIFHFMSQNGFNGFLQINPQYQNTKLLYCDMLFFRQ